MVWACDVKWRVCDGVWTCLSRDVELFSVFGGLVIEVDAVDTFLDLCRGLGKVWPIVNRLVGIYVEYDLPQWVSAHCVMDRRVQRLRKLLRILDEMSVEVRVGGRRKPLSIGGLLRPVTAMLGEIVEVLEFFKDEVHRVRDRVHTFVYPALLSLFDVLRRPWHIIMTIGFESHLVAEVSEKVSIDLEVKAPGMRFSKRVDEKVLEYAIRKGEPLEILREMVRKIVEREARKLKPIEIEEVPSTLWAR